MGESRAVQEQLPRDDAVERTGMYSQRVLSRYVGYLMCWLMHGFFEPGQVVHIHVCTEFILLCERIEAHSGQFV